MRFISNETFIDLKFTQHDRLDDHEQRIIDLEDQIHHLQNEDYIEYEGKKRKKGGDRAAWYRIRDEDYPTRAEWCVPGGVFGWYRDGIGPLLPNHLRPRRAAVVYSTAPDTLEEHPDPNEYDHYAPIVLVESPDCQISPILGRRGSGQTSR